MGQFAEGASPEPPASEDWTTITIALDQFQRGAWSADENDRLDLGDVGSLAIGVHGTSSEAAATGAIWATDIQLVP